MEFERKFHLNNLKIRDKLIIYFICLIILPITFIFLLTYTKLSDIVQEKISNYGSVIIREVCNDIDETLNNATDSKYTVLFNDEIQRILERQNATKIDLFQEKTTIENYIISILNAKECVQSVTIYNNYGSSYFYSTILADRPYDYDDIKNSTFYKEIIEANGKIVWKGYDKSRNSYTMGMQLLSKQNLQQIGIMVINVDMTSIEKIFYKSKTEKLGRFYIVDKNGVVIFHTDRDKVGSKQETELLSLIESPDRHIFSTQYNGERYVTVTYLSSTSNWRYVYDVPEKDMMKEIIIIRNFLLVVFGGALILSILFAVIISFGLTRHINHLMKQMKRAETGNLDARVVIRSKDEIGQLGEKFNAMISNIQNLINSVYKEELLRKNAEIEALQAQINPHFLYNTLDSINALAELRGVDDISKITVAFSKLLRASISNAKNIVTLEEEISYISNYMTIIRIRYNNRINFISDLQRDTLQCNVPKLIIQPLVENAIVHGLEDKTGYCEVSIRSWIENDLLLIEVVDNGVGIDLEDLETKQKLKDSSGSKHSGLGLNNVRKRIELMYGLEYGLNIRSQKDEGTAIRLILPVINDFGEAGV